MKISNVLSISDYTCLYRFSEILRYTQTVKHPITFTYRLHQDLKG